MRALIVLLALACATPAAAQSPLTIQREAELQSQIDMNRQNNINLHNRLSTFEAQQQTNQALDDIAAMRQRPSLPTIYDPNSPPPLRAAVPPGAYASMPDSVLAASNARVRAAAANRR